MVLAVVGLLSVLIVEVVIMYKVASLGGVPWRSVWLGQLLLLAICLAYLNLIAFVLKPSVVTCSIIRGGVGVCYALMQSVMCVKILMVLSPKTEAGFLKLGHQVLILILILLVQVIISAQWLIVVPPRADTLRNDMLVCKATYFSSLFYEMLASFSYIGLVGTVLFALTLITYSKNRKANGKPISEAKWILVTCCVTAATWVAWVIVGSLLPEVGMAALAVGLWVTATGTLLIMFVPKLHRLATLKRGGESRL